MTTDTARRERANEYEGMTFYDLCCLVIQRDDEIAALRTSCDEWRARASNKTTDNMDLRSEIAALRDRVSRYERTQADWPIVEGEYKAEIAALREAVRLGNKVMLKLKEHGPAIVPHLLDDDENDGERFRQAIRALEQKP